MIIQHTEAVKAGNCKLHHDISFKISPEYKKVTTKPRFCQQKLVHVGAVTFPALKNHALLICAFQAGNQLILYRQIITNQANMQERFPDNNQQAIWLLIHTPQLPKTQNFKSQSRISIDCIITISRTKLCLFSHNKSGRANAHFEVISKTQSGYPNSNNYTTYMCLLTVLWLGMNMTLSSTVTSRTFISTSVLASSIPIIIQNLNFKNRSLNQNARDG